MATEYPPMTDRRCARCGGQYGPPADAEGQYVSWCRSCRNDYSRKWQQEERKRLSMIGPIHGPRRLRPVKDLCGSYSGAQRHRNLGEQLCDPCADAEREYQREYSRKRRARGPVHGPKIPLLKVCKSCGEEFWTHKKQQVNCTLACAERNRDRSARDFTPRTPRRCAVCGDVFMVLKPSSPTLYCSSACRRTLPHGPTLPPAEGPEKPSTISAPCLLCGEMMWDVPPMRKRHDDCTRQHLIDRTMELYETAYKVADVKRACMWRYKLVEYLRNRDGDLCGLCGELMDFDVTTGPLGESDQGATIDHVHPRSLGGGNEEENLQLAHWSCNRAKGNRVG